MSTVIEPISIAVGDAVRVSGLLQMPSRARACYVLAHGTGAGMDHPFIVEVARVLALNDVATWAVGFSLCSPVC